MEPFLEHNPVKSSCGVKSATLATAAVRKEWVESDDDLLWGDDLPLARVCYGASSRCSQL